MTYYFFRITSDSEGDVERGFSCNVNSWFDNYEDAKDYENRHGALSSPKQDPKTKKWCADPELGLSGFGFHDGLSMHEARVAVSAYGDDFFIGLVGKDYAKQIGVFSAKKFWLKAGLDGEDVFEPDKFLGYYDELSDDFLKSLLENRIRRYESLYEAKQVGLYEKL